MPAFKVYVGVDAYFRQDGTVLPRSVTWEDGRTFGIDRVADVRRAAALRAGGTGDRYTVWIRGRMTYLFYERIPLHDGREIGRWFVERRGA